MYYKYFRFTTGRILPCTRKNFSYSTISRTYNIQYKKSERKWQCLKFHKSNFHTTQSNLSSNFTLTIGSIICGYYVRKWWLKQPAMQQEKYLRWYKQNKNIFHGSLIFLSFLLIFYYNKHIVRDPILKKRRVVLNEQDQQITNSKIYSALVIQNKENVVPLNDQSYTRVAKALKKLIKSNGELFINTNWTITIIYRMFNIQSIPNVLILPAHEVAHELLLHTEEAASFAKIENAVTSILSFLTWASYSTKVASTLFCIMQILSYTILCWYKRQNEMEADEVGLELAAKSCIDIREVFVFFEIMMEYEKLKGLDKFHASLFNLHPTLETRMKRATEQMPKLLELRDYAQCPQLPTTDPRDRLPRYLKDIKKHVTGET